LHRIREREQHNQVKGIELRQLAFSEDSQEPDEEYVNDNRPRDLFDDRQTKRKHVVAEGHNGKCMP